MKRLAVVFAVSMALGGFSGPTSAEEGHHPGEAEAEKMGRVSFPVSCTPQARERFETGVTLLHSFWYARAEQAFSEALATDEKCAMAHWGIAMSQYFPLWAPPDGEKLKKGFEAVRRAKAIGPKTKREKDYVAAMEAFYKGYEKHDHRTRALAYEKAMKRLYRDYPEDAEAAAFYALALNSTALPADKTYRNQKKAAKILEVLFKRNPDHPGVAHYMIHSFDSPALASKAEGAARRYAAIAPAVPHALHMPSHIFTRLGLWQESIDSNRASSSALRAAADAPAGSASFEDLHAMDYLMYAYLQRAQDGLAKGVLEEVKAVEKAMPENFASAYALAAMPARYVLEKALWEDAVVLRPHPPDFPWAKFSYAEAIIHYARAIGAARSGDLKTARLAKDKLSDIHEGLANDSQDYWAGQVDIQQQAASAWILWAEEKRGEALSLMRAAADLEDAVEKHPVTPGPILPVREMLGELLLGADQPEKAFKAFELSLKSSPNRFNAYYGAARAAKSSGDAETAATYYEKLVDLSDSQEGDRPALKEARAFLTSHTQAR